MFAIIITTLGGETEAGGARIYLRACSELLGQQTRSSVAVFGKKFCLGSNPSFSISLGRFCNHSVPQFPCL